MKLKGKDSSPVLLKVFFHLCTHVYLNVCVHMTAVLTDALQLELQAAVLHNTVVAGN